MEMSWLTAETVAGSRGQGSLRPASPQPSEGDAVGPRVTQEGVRARGVGGISPFRIIPWLLLARSLVACPLPQDSQSRKLAVGDSWLLNRNQSPRSAGVHSPAPQVTPTLQLSPLPAQGSVLWWQRRGDVAAAAAALKLVPEGQTWPDVAMRQSCDVRCRTAGSPPSPCSRRAAAAPEQVPVTGGLTAATRQNCSGGRGKARSLTAKATRCPLHGNLRRWQTQTDTCSRRERGSRRDPRGVPRGRAKAF